MEDHPLDDVREDIEVPQAPAPGRDPRAGGPSGLTRWVAQRHMKDQPRPPTYERCQEKACWGKATWTCPRCRRKVCSAHHPEHHCSLPYLPNA